MAFSPLPIAIATLATTITFFLLFRRFRAKLPPGPKPWPIVGNLYDIKPVRFRCFQEWAQTYGPIMSVWFGSNLNVIVSTTELAREVLKENDQALADRARNRSTARFSRDGKDLIWADYGPHYVKVRKLCNLELFSPRRLEALRPIREDEVTAMVESIFKDCTHPDNIGKSLVVRRYLSWVAFNNITRLAFGKRFVNSEGIVDKQGIEFKEIIDNGVKLGGSLSFAEYVPWLQKLFPLNEDAIAKHGDRRDRLTRTIMDEHNRARKQSGGSKKHFIDALHNLKDQYNLSEDNIIGLLWDMIVAGTDTTIINTEWALAEIVKHPRVQAKVQEEMDRVIGANRIMTEADFPNLPYLQCIVKEALRLHPPTPLMLPHKASTNVKIGGYDIPKGSIVQVNVWAIARDPKVWKNPLEFRPERFEEENIDIKGSDFRVLPFGAGRRVCPGAQLAINMVQSMLGHLLHHFKWDLPQGMKQEDIDMSENPGVITFMHTPLEAVATPRLPSADLYTRMVVDM